MTGPHSCFIFASGFRFELVESDNILEDPVVVVSRIENLGQFGKKTGFTDNIKAVTIGDQLLTVNGQTFNDVTLLLLA